MPEIVMPRLSDSMEEGTILTWLKQVGDEVAVGDELVEVETDKANMAYESDVAGTLTEILAQEGDTLEIGKPIAVVGNGTSPTDTPAGSSSKAAGPAAPPPPEPSVDVPAPPAGVSVGEAQKASGSGAERVKASPLARRIAEENGVDLAGLKGSGPDGRIVKKDVEAAEAPVASAPQRAVVGADATGTAETAKGTTTVQELTRLQQVVARRMSESKATAPHFYLQTEIDMSAAVEARGRIKAMSAEGEVVPSFNDMVVKACALALKAFPVANGAYKDGRFELYSRVNVGVAVAAQDALVVPTVFDADKQGPAGDRIRLAIARRQGEGRLDHPTGALRRHLHGLEPRDVRGDELLRGDQRPTGRDPRRRRDRREARGPQTGSITTAHMLGVTLACDHRILYGAPAAEFLARIRSLLEEPLALAL